MCIQPGPRVAPTSRAQSRSSESKTIRDLSEFFSSSVTRELLDRGDSPKFARLARATRVAEHFDRATSVGEVFDQVFSSLCREELRYDYIYRAVLTRNFFFGRHSLKSATILSEFRVGESKADLAIFNGTSTAYEIKSDRDSLARLSKQLDDYKRVFARIYVVCGDTHLGAVVDSTPDDVGILRVSRRAQIATIRVAKEELERVEAQAVLNSLRTEEAIEVLTRLGLEVPVVANTRLRRELARLFAIPDPSALHGAMVATLKRSRSAVALGSFLDCAPSSLRSALLFAGAAPKEQARFLSAVQSPVSTALEWG